MANSYSEVLDPELQSQLKLKTFEGKFDVKDFVGTVSDNLISQSKNASGPFDPKPFIRTFEAAVDKLIAVRKDVQAKTEQMEKSVRLAEREYSKKMSDLNRGFEGVGSNFTGMESKMNEVGRTAIRIGEQLESITLERQRAQAAYDLIDYYNQFSKGDTSRLDTLKKEGSREGRRQVAVILRRLTTLAREVDLPNSEKTREKIDQYCESFEKEMLHMWDRSYRRGDPKAMNHVAQTLLDFNGGGSCVQVYVNQHDFFINRGDKYGAEYDSLLWKSVPDPDETPPKSEAGFAALLNEVRDTMAVEADIVRAVFPNPPLVMQVFLQRVFAQPIQQHVEMILNRGSYFSELAFLRVLQIVHIQTSALVEDLKTYDLSVTTISSKSSESRMMMGTASGAAGTGGAAPTMASMLETAMEELFVPYTEGQRYVERESKSLGELYAKKLTAFTRYHTRVLEGGKSTMFGRMMNQLTAASGTGSGTATSGAAAALMRFGGYNATTNTKAPEKPEEDPIKDEDGQLSVHVAETMLKWHAEAIGRCVELSTANDVPKHTFSLLRVLAAVIGSGYVEMALETVRARLEVTDSKADPPLQVLGVLRDVDLICHLWQQYVNIALFPLASGSVIVRREMAVFNSQTISRIEGAANNAMQLLTDVIVAWLRTQLEKQKRADFKPRNDDLSFARMNTEPCEACCSMLEKVRDAAKANLSGKNLEVFLTEVGVSLHGLLLDHLRKFPVSATGGLMLAKDLKLYQDTIATFSVPALDERFEFVRQLGTLFLVQPDALKSFIAEGVLGRIEGSLLRPYLAQRSDWGQVENRFDGADEPASIMPPARNSGSSIAAMRLGGGTGMSRLSAMMRDLENVKLGEGIALPSFANASEKLGGLSNRMSAAGLTVPTGVSVAGAKERMSALAGNYSWTNGAFGTGS